MADFGNSLKNIWMRSMEAIGNTASSIASNTRFKVDEMNVMNRKAEILKDFGAKAYALWQKGEHFPEELEEQLKELGQLDEKLNDMRAEHFAGVETAKTDPEPVEEAADAADEENAEENDAVISGDTEQPANEEGENGEDDEEGTDGSSEAGAEDIVGGPAETASGAAPDVTADAEEKEDETDGRAAGTLDEIGDDVPVIRVEAAEETEKKDTPLSSAINDLFERIPDQQKVDGQINSALDSLEAGLKKFSDGLDNRIEELNQKIQGEKPE